MCFDFLNFGSPLKKFKKTHQTITTVSVQYHLSAVSTIIMCKDQSNIILKVSTEKPEEKKQCKINTSFATLEILKTPRSDVAKPETVERFRNCSPNGVRNTEKLF